jgi:two-component system, response regulator
LADPERIAARSGRQKMNNGKTSASYQVDRSKVRILLVEDNADDVELTRRVFERAGVMSEAHVVSDGAAALEFVFGAGSYEGKGIPAQLVLVLLDLNLPKVPGIDILRRLKNDPRTAPIHVVMLTSSEQERDVLESYNFGINGYMLKPIEYERFLHAYDTFVRE